MSAGSEPRQPGAGVEEAPLPLCVDLDGTLIATDTLWESLLLCVRARPLALWRLPLWLLEGRHGFKVRVAALAVPDPALLPYRPEVLAYVREARAAGRPVVLATAADRAVAHAVAAHLGLFSEVHASGAEGNLKGARKRALLEEAYGPRGFEYLGDSPVDLPVWEGAGAASVVGPPERARRIGSRAPLARHFVTDGGSPRTWLRALRVHQWVKNVLVFLPVVMAHRADLPILLQAALAFLCLSLCASAVYLVNDLMDLAADRAHPTKRRRPFAAGTLPLAAGVAVAPALLAGAAALSLATLPPLFSAALGVYVVSNGLYTFWLKRVAIADVIFLAGLYSLRVLAGGFATGIAVSPWLIAFSLFFFLNLAILKRYADLRLLGDAETAAAPGRDYVAGDAPLLLSLGPASGYMAAVILSLYVQSEKVVMLYAQPVLLWLLVPLLAFWVSRMWLLAHRGRMTDDPVLFTTRDPASYAVGALAAAILAAATLL